MTTTAVRVIPLGVVAIAGIFFVHGSHFHPFNTGGQSGLDAVTAAATLTLFAFVGLESATVAAGARPAAHHPAGDGDRHAARRGRLHPRPDRGARRHPGRRAGEVDRAARGRRLLGAGAGPGPGLAVAAAGIRPVLPVHVAGGPAVRDRRRGHPVAAAVAGSAAHGAARPVDGPLRPGLAA
jgi:hypothetical protein